MALTDAQEKEVKDAMDKMKAKLAELEKGAPAKKGGRISALEEKLSALEKKLEESSKKKGWWDSF